MTMKMICVAAALTALVASQASAGSLIGGRGGVANGSINIAPRVNALNGNNTSVLSGILSGNSILNGSNVLSGNGGLLGLGILSGNNNDNSKNKNRR